MIHCKVTRNPVNKIDGIHISVTEESMAGFIQMVNRATNCWDSAPQDIKEMAHKLSHPPEIPFPGTAKDWTPW